MKDCGHTWKMMTDVQKLAYYELFEQKQNHKNLQKQEFQARMQVKKEEHRRSKYRASTSKVVPDLVETGST